MHPKAITVRRTVTRHSDVDLLIDSELMGETEALTYTEENQDDLAWTEVDVITHFTVVENYA